jgi:hypothetical protein
VVPCDGTSVSSAARLLGISEEFPSASTDSAKSGGATANQ